MVCSEQTGKATGDSFYIILTQIILCWISADLIQTFSRTFWIALWWLWSETTQDPNWKWLLNFSLIPKRLSKIIHYRTFWPFRSHKRYKFPLLVYLFSLSLCFHSILRLPVPCTIAPIGWTTCRTAISPFYTFHPTQTHREVPRYSATRFPSIDNSGLWA